MSRTCSGRLDFSTGLSAPLLWPCGSITTRGKSDRSLAIRTVRGEESVQFLLPVSTRSDPKVSEHAWSWGILNRRKFRRKSAVQFVCFLGLDEFWESSGSDGLLVKLCIVAAPQRLGSTDVRGNSRSGIL